jgi:hypothetical protein
VRKPAISNIGRPQGFLDDVVGPLAKAAKPKRLCLLRFNNRLPVARLSAVLWLRPSRWLGNIMGSKPRKAFDGIARPQGFIDDAAKAWCARKVSYKIMAQRLLKRLVRTKVHESTAGAEKSPTEQNVTNK